MTEKELIVLYNNIYPNVRCSSNQAAYRHDGIWTDMTSVVYGIKQHEKSLIVFNKEKMILHKFKTFKLDEPNLYGELFITKIDHTENYTIKDLTEDKAKYILDNALTDYIKLVKFCATKNKEWDLEKDFT